jgi:hypothetical protein
VAGSRDHWIVPLTWANAVWRVLGSPADFGMFALMDVA